MLPAKSPCSFVSFRQIWNVMKWSQDSLSKLKIVELTSSRHSVSQRQSKMIIMTMSTHHFILKCCLLSGFNAQRMTLSTLLLLTVFCIFHTTILNTKLNTVTYFPFEANMLCDKGENKWWNGMWCNRMRFDKSLIIGKWQMKDTCSYMLLYCAHSFRRCIIGS